MVLFSLVRILLDFLHGPLESRHIGIYFFPFHLLLSIMDTSIFVFDFVNLYPFSTAILCLSPGWAGINEPFMLHSSSLFFMTCLPSAVLMT